MRLSRIAFWRQIAAYPAAARATALLPELTIPPKPPARQEPRVPVFDAYYGSYQPGTRPAHPLMPRHIARGLHNPWRRKPW